LTNHPAAIVDACVATNLFASQAWDEIFAGCALTPVLSAQAAKETLWILDAEGERTPIDVQALQSAGRLEIWPPTDPELPVLVELAATLGDGEAACLAIAKAGGLPLATDDRAARRAAAKYGMGSQLLSTSQVIRRWQTRTRATRERTAVILGHVTTCASYLPADDDPHCAWWHAQIGE
jgi:hypothetical protein